jgi:hypothetical protein
MGRRALANILADVTPPIYNRGRIAEERPRRFPIRASVARPGSLNRESGYVL